MSAVDAPAQHPLLPTRRRGGVGWIALISALSGAAAAAVHFGLVTLPGAAPPAALPATETEKPPAAVVVTVGPATLRPVERRVRTVGTLHGFEEIDISPLVDGRVVRVAHDVGDIVAPGETLLDIDDTDFRLAVDEVERSLELELAALGLSTAPDGAFDIRQLPGVERAELVERSAAETLERYRGLVERNAITKDEIQKAELALDTARLDRKQRLLEAEQALAAVIRGDARIELEPDEIAGVIADARGEGLDPEQTFDRLILQGEWLSLNRQARIRPR